MHAAAAVCLVLLLLAPAAAGRTFPSTPHPPPPPPPTLQCSLVGADSLRFDGARHHITLCTRRTPASPCLNRSFSLTLPLGAYSASELPLAFALHGGEEGADDFLDGSDGGDPNALPIDVQLASRGFVTIGPNALVNPIASSLLAMAGQCGDSPNCSLAFWEGTSTALDAANLLSLTSSTDEVAFLWDAASCARDVLGLNLSGSVFAFGHSQGGKLASFFGCSEPRAGFSVDGIVASAGVKADPLAAPRCRDPRRRPPPLLAFQAQEDETVPFCSPFLYAPGAVYWSYWAQMAQCSAGERTLSSSTALCPAPQSGPAVLATNTTLLRVFVDSSCASPTALFWTSESNPSFGYHRWPGPMEALGGRDGTGVAIDFFQNIVAAHPRHPTSAQAFAGLTDALSAAACGVDRNGPCASDPYAARALADDLATVTAGLQSLWGLLRGL